MPTPSVGSGCSLTQNTPPLLPLLVPNPHGSSFEIQPKGCPEACKAPLSTTNTLILQLEPLELFFTCKLSFQTRPVIREYTTVLGI